MKCWWMTVIIGSIGCAASALPPGAADCPPASLSATPPPSSGDTSAAPSTTPPPAPTTAPPEPSSCVGNSEPPAQLADALQPIEDAALLAAALGNPGEGKLCQGKVYQVKEGAQIVLYRAWNSTHTGSRLGKWWAAEKPQGRVAQYRSDYEICYQWSPLDKLTHCSVKAGTKLVIGTGQSASCSEYLKYPVSAAKQVYFANADQHTSDCSDFDGLFSWQADTSGGSQ